MAMAFWHFDLNEDEDLVVDQKPHWSVLLAPVFQLLLLTVLTVSGIVILSFLPSWTLFFPLAALVILICRLGLRIVKYKASHLIITTERLIHINGAIGRRVREIPIGQISNLSYSQKMLDRMLGFGALEVDHSGENGKDIFNHVLRPDRIVRLTSSQISRHSSARGIGNSVSPIDELSKLAELRRAGSITQDEYELAKSRLLNQI